MKEKLEYYAWNPFLFRADTQRLTRDQRNAYRDILDEIFVTEQAEGSLVDDDEYLASVCGVAIERWMKIRRALIDGARPLLFVTPDGRIASTKLRREIEKAHEKTGNRSRAANMRWNRVRAEQQGDDAEQKHSSAMHKNSTDDELHCNARREEEERRKRRKEKSQQHRAHEATVPKAVEKAIDDKAEGAGIGDVEIVSKAIAVCAPKVYPDDFTISQWLRDYHPDPYWIAAALFDAEALSHNANDGTAKIREATTIRFLTKIVATRAAEKWEMDGCREFVEFRLRRKKAAGGEG